MWRRREHVRLQFTVSEHAKQLVAMLASALAAGSRVLACGGGYRSHLMLADAVQEREHGLQLCRHPSISSRRQAGERFANAVLCFSERR